MNWGKIDRRKFEEKWICTKTLISKSGTVDFTKDKIYFGFTDSGGTLGLIDNFGSVHIVIKNRDHFEKTKGITKIYLPN